MNIVHKICDVLLFSEWLYSPIFQVVVALPWILIIFLNSSHCYWKKAALLSFWKNLSYHPSIYFSKAVFLILPHYCKEINLIQYWNQTHEIYYWNFNKTVLFLLLSHKRINSNICQTNSLTYSLFLGEGRWGGGREEIMPTKTS